MGLSVFFANRPTFFGLESYLSMINREVNSFKPNIAIIDTISSFIMGSNELESKLMIMRLVDFLKMNQITAFMTNLSAGGSALEHTRIDISSLIDTWLLFRDIELEGERNRGLYILKSRGMKHSNQVREFLLTDHGIELLDVYTGPNGVLTGSARRAQEEKDRGLKQSFKTKRR